MGKIVKDVKRYETKAYGNKVARKHPLNLEKGFEGGGVVLGAVLLLLIAVVLVVKIFS